MKRMCFVFIMLLISFSASATSYLGRFVTDQLLLNIYGSHSAYCIIEGGFDEHNRFYPKTEFYGYISDGVKLTIETGRSGRITMTSIEYENISSEKHLKSTIESIINVDHITVQKRQTRNNGDFDCGISIEGILPSSYTNLQSAYIEASWDYNGFGKFFFNYLSIIYICSSYS